jgi:hypothetical protein
MLKHAADSTFDDLSRGQVMADTLVERVTGRAAEAPGSVTLNLVMSDQRPPVPATVPPLHRCPVHR